MVDILDPIQACAAIVAVFYLFSLALHVPLEPFYPQDDPDGLVELARHQDSGA